MLGFCLQCRSHDCFIPCVSSSSDVCHLSVRERFFCQMFSSPVFCFYFMNSLFHLSFCLCYFLYFILFHRFSSYSNILWFSNSNLSQLRLYGGPRHPPCTNPPTPSQRLSHFPQSLSSLPWRRVCVFNIGNPRRSLSTKIRHAFPFSSWGKQEKPKSKFMLSDFLVYFSSSRPSVLSERKGGCGSQVFTLFMLLQKI